MLKTESFILQLKALGEVKSFKAEMLKNEENGSVKLCLVTDYGKIELCGESTEAVFSKLSESLNGKCDIQSCYTCRYGNFCPTGDRDNKIFCINDFEPKCKEDLFFVTENQEERIERSRNLFYVCSDFKPCSNNYYTYK